MLLPETISEPFLGDHVPVFCRDELVARCLGNLDFAKRTLTRFRQDFAGGLVELRQAVEEGEPERIATIAHRLKGASAIVAAHRLRHWSGTIESLGRGRDQHQMLHCLTSLEQEWSRFHENCES